jgi:hypothetical protein
MEWTKKHNFLLWMISQSPNGCVVANRDTSYKRHSDDLIAMKMVRVKGGTIFITKKGRAILDSFQ